MAKLQHALNKRADGDKLRNEYYTPEYAVETLIPYLKQFKGKTIWEPTDPEGERGIYSALQKAGHVIYFSGLPKTDFFLQEKPLGDIVVTNPPYGKRDREKFMRKLFNWGIPWAMLMPLTTLEGVARGKIWQKYGCELLVHDNRPAFIPGVEKKYNSQLLVEEAEYKVKVSVPWFNASWFCSGILPEKLMFAKIEK